MAVFLSSICKFVVGGGSVSNYIILPWKLSLSHPRVSRLKVDSFRFVFYIRFFINPLVTFSPGIL